MTTLFTFSNLWKARWHFMACIGKGVFNAENGSCEMRTLG